MISIEFEAKTNIKFMVNFRQKISSIIDSLNKVYDDITPKKNNLLLQSINHFLSRRLKIKDDLCSSRPSTSACVENIHVVRDLIEKHRRITTKSVVETLTIIVDSAQTILVQNFRLCKPST